MIKPDGASRGLENEIFLRVEKTGLKIIKKKNIVLTKDMAADLYSPHLGKKFYPGLIKFITSGPVVCSMIEGKNAIERVRQLMGATDPRQAEVGTIRGDLKEENVVNADGVIKNLVHGSDSLGSAKREIAIFFKGGE
ncbi:MAG: nucleoside-diphosphate kinase [Candidatus Margulisiibacteriota bacterium]